MSCVRWDSESPREFASRDGRTYTVAPGILFVPEIRLHGKPAEGTDWLSLRTQSFPGPSAVSPVVVFLAGGPGESAIQWPRHGPFLRAFETLQKVAEVVLIDQRGCGASVGKLSVARGAPLPADALRTEADLIDAYRNDARQRSNALRSAGVPITAYTPEDSADDIADLVRCAPNRAVVLLGYSYGSHLAMAAIRRHPGVFERAILCGFEGPDQTLKLPSQIDLQIARIAAIVAAQGGPPDLKSLMRRVHRRLAAAPVAVPSDANSLPTALGEAGLRHIVAGWCSLSNRMGRIARLYTDLERGGTQEAAEAVALFAKTWPKPPAFFLNDSASGISQERLATIHREAASDHFVDGPILGNAANWPFPGIRTDWGQRDLGDEFRKPFATDLPMLIFTGGLDGFTPTTNLPEALAGLPNTSHYEIACAAHNDLLVCSAAVEAMARFVAGDKMAAGQRFAVPVPTLA